MGKLLYAIGKQCGNPRGIVGRIMTFGMNRTNGAMYKAIIANSGFTKDNTVLDIGFGNGYFIRQLYKKVKCNIFGVEISQDMLNNASARNKQGIEAGDIKLSLGDCCDLSFAEGSFDKVTTMNTIYFWSDTEKGMSEIYRVLKEGGSFTNAVFDERMLKRLPFTKNVFHYFNKEDYERLGRQAGFRSIEFKMIREGYSFLVIYHK